MQFHSPGSSPVRMRAEHRGPQGVTGQSEIRFSPTPAGVQWAEVAKNGKGKPFATLAMDWNRQGELINATWEDLRKGITGSCTTAEKGVALSIQQGEWKTLYQIQGDEVPFPLLKLALQNRFPHLTPGEPFGVNLIIPELALQLQKQGLPETWMRVKLTGRLGNSESITLGGQTLVGRWVELVPADSLMQSFLPEDYRSIRFLLQEAAPHWPLVMVQGKQEFRLVRLEAGEPKTPAGP